MSRLAVVALALVGAVMVAASLLAPRLAPRVALAAERPVQRLGVQGAPPPGGASGWAGGSERRGGAGREAAVQPAETARRATAAPESIDTGTPTETPTGTPGASATATATATPTSTNTATATGTPTPTATATRAPAAAVPILMYHYIRANPDPTDRVGYGLSVSPDLFSAHMAFLAERGYRAVPLRDLTRTQKTIALTFDDGYRDFYTAAWPAMTPHGYRATIFQIVDLIDNHRYLTTEQLRELAAAGNEVGSHTLGHPDLTALSPDRVRREVAESRVRLELLIGQPVLSFCYPAGRQNAAVRKAVEAAGYTSAVTVQPGLHREADDRFAIPRVRVYGGMGLAQLARAIGEPPPDPVRWERFLRDRAGP